MFVGGVTNIIVNTNLHTWTGIATSRNLHDHILTYGNCWSYHWLQREKERRKEGGLTMLSFFYIFHHERIYMENSLRYLSW